MGLKSKDCGIVVKEEVGEEGCKDSGDVSLYNIQILFFCCDLMLSTMKVWVFILNLDVKMN